MPATFESFLSSGTRNRNATTDSLSFNFSGKVNSKLFIALYSPNFSDLTITGLTIGGAAATFQAVSFTGGTWPEVKVYEVLPANMPTSAGAQTVGLTVSADAWGWDFALVEISGLTGAAEFGKFNDAYTTNTVTASGNTTSANAFVMAFGSTADGGTASLDGSFTVPSGGTWTHAYVNSSAVFGYKNGPASAGSTSATANGSVSTGNVYVFTLSNTLAAADTLAPTVSLASSSTNVTSAGNITLTATASDNVGVTQVEFFDGVTLLGTDTSSPFTQTVSLASANNGTKTYTAKAYDAAGNVTTSSAVTVTVNIPVTDSTAPTVSLASSSTNVTSNSTITLTATAADNIGVTEVRFYKNGTQIASDTSSPFTTSVSLTAADNGTIAFTARAYDAAGNSTLSSAVNVVVSISAGPATPVVEGVVTAGNKNRSAQTDSANFNFTGKSNSKLFVIVSTPSNSDAQITGVTINGGASVGAKVPTTGSFSNYEQFKVWEILPANMPAAGTYPVAITLGGEVYGWDFCLVEVSNLSSGASEVAQRNYVGANTSDAVSLTTASASSFVLGIGGTETTGVTASLDPAFTQIATWTHANPAGSNAVVGWKTGPASAGSSSLTVSSATASDLYALILSSAVASTASLDTTAPTVSLASTSASVTAAGSITLTATAADNVAVTRVEFYDNGSLIASDTSSPYTASVVLSAANNGSHVYTARAYDAAGNATISTGVTVTVSIVSTDSTAPTVSLAASSTNITSATSVTLTATASDNIGISRVDFYDGSTLVGSDSTSPYTHVISYTASNNGTHSYTARAYDTSGNSTLSSAVTVTVNIASAVVNNAIVGFVGHSLISQHAPEYFRQMVTAVGGKTLTAEDHLNAGGTLNWNWNNAGMGTYHNGNTSTNLRTLIAAAGATANKFDTLVITEAVPIDSHLNWSGSLDYAIQWRNLLLQYNSSAKAYYYMAWPGFYSTQWWPNVPPGDDGWRSAIDVEAAKQENLVAQVNADSRSTVGAPLRIWPMHKALGLFYDRMKAGQYSWISNIHDIFLDDIHLNNLGWVFVAIFDWCATYREKPTVAPLVRTYDGPWGGSVTPTTQQVTDFINAAWDALSAYSGFDLGATSDSSAPVVSLAASSSSVTAAGSVTFTASASDNVGVTRVEFYRGSNLISTDTSSPYSVAVAFTSADNGTIAFSARAYDSAGNVTTSNTVNVVVNIATSSITKFVGMNLPGLCYFGGYSPFSNKWLSAGVATEDETWVAGWNSSGAITLNSTFDSAGYPTNLTGGQSAICFFNIDRVGSYTFLWDGAGSFNLSGCAKNVVTVSAGRITFNVDTLTDSNGNYNNWVMFTITAIAAGNHIRNIRCFKTSLESTYQTTDFFDPDVISVLKNMSVVRYMDIMRTNEQTIVNWSDRTTTSRFSQASPRGVAVEYLCQLANKLGVDPWFNVPALANDDYMTQLGTCVRDNLDVNLNPHFEYSNEVWNGIFSQTHDVSMLYADLLALYPVTIVDGYDTKEYQRALYSYSRRACKMFELVLAQYPTNRKSSVKRVLASQMIAWSAGEVLDFESAKTKCDFFACAPYWGYSVSLDPNVLTYTDAQIVNLLNSEIDSSMATVTAIVNAASSRGIPVIAYEGGNHTVGDLAGSNSPAATVIFNRIIRSSAIGPLYTKYLNEWKSRTNNAKIALWHLVGSYSNFGEWGMAEDMDQLMATSTTYKWAAVQTFIPTSGTGGAGTGGTSSDTQAPAVNLATSASTVASIGSITLTATASDNVGVSEVRFYRNGVLIGTDTTAPYTQVVSFTAADNGTVQFTSVAYDAAGNSTTSNQVAVTVAITTDTTPPVVSLSANQTNVTATGLTTLTAIATDNVGVTRVDFYEGTTLIGSKTTAPYTLQVSLAYADNGTKTYRARAYDAAGNEGVSGSVIVTVAIPATDATPPSVLITTSSASVTAQGSITLAATASNMTVSRVEFYEGSTLLGTVNSAPYSLTLTFTNANNGTHTYFARVYDSAGNITTSSSVQTSVNIPAVVADTTAPTVSMTSSNSTVTASGNITLTAAASDNIGIQDVRFYRNGVLFATATQAPYQVQIAMTAAYNGTNTFTAVARDLAGNVTTSSSVVVTAAITGASSATGVATVRRPDASLPPPESKLTIYKGYKNPVSLTLVDRSTSNTVDLSTVVRMVAFVGDQRIDSVNRPDIFDWTKGEGRVDLFLGMVDSIKAGDYKLGLVAYDASAVDGVMFTSPVAVVPINISIVFVN